MDRPVNRIFLVRHGETAGNRDRIVMGIRDVPLTEKGEVQATGLRPFFEGVRLDRAYCSSLQRAARTSELLLDGRDLIPTYLDDLKEQDYGEWEGRPFGELERQDPDLARQFFVDPASVTIPGGEPFNDFRERVTRAFDDQIQEKKMGHNILVVAHGGSIRILVSHLLALPYSTTFFRLWIDNASVTEVMELAPGYGILARLNCKPG